jgi:hypothetical protein
VAEGVTARVLGPKAVGREAMPDSPAVSVEVDHAIEDATEVVGRYLNAAGEGLREHPLDPMAAVHTAQEKVAEPAPVPEGWSPLVGGLRSLGGGLFKVAEGVLDRVAPRKKNDDPG